MRTDPSVELGQAHRFDQVVVGTRLQPHDDVHLGRPRGQHDQHTARLDNPELPAHLDAVEVGQPQVQQHQIEVGFGGSA